MSGGATIGLSLLGDAVFTRGGEGECIRVRFGGELNGVGVDGILECSCSARGAERRLRDKHACAVIDFLAASLVKAGEFAGRIPDVGFNDGPGGEIDGAFQSVAAVRLEFYDHFDGGENLERRGTNEEGAGALGGAKVIGGDDMVVAEILSSYVGEDQLRVGGAGDRCSVKAPLIGNGRGADGRNGEGGGLAESRRYVLRLSREDNWWGWDGSVCGGFE